MDSSHPQTRARRLTGREPLTGCRALRRGPGIPVRHFWRWAWSDLADPAARGRVAEYLVGVAVGDPAVRRGARCDRGTTDVCMDGLRLQVRSCGATEGEFRVARPRRSVAAGCVSVAYDRRAEVVDAYVLAHLTTGPDAAQRDVLDARRWRFHAVSAAVLDTRLGASGALSLGRLSGLAAVGEVIGPVALDDLRAAVLMATAVPVQGDGG
jgi:hypothetical protein